MRASRRTASTISFAVLLRCPRRRLSIARALLKEPPILILDEATSALDAKTEPKLLAALEEVMKGRTTFVIAHRLATIRRADRILMFEHGRVVDTGTFDDLVRARGPFAELAKAQYLSAEPPTLPGEALSAEASKIRAAE
jgi:ATP-binding cassette subfamily B protein